MRHLRQHLRMYEDDVAKDKSEASEAKDDNEALKDKVRDLLNEIEGDTVEPTDAPSPAEDIPAGDIPDVKVEVKSETPVDVAVKTPPKPEVPAVEKEVEEALDEGLY